MEPTQTLDYHSNVDTSRPFRSVKEAVAVFGERLLAGDLYSSKPTTASTAIVLHHKEQTPPQPQQPSQTLMMVKSIEYGTTGRFSVETSLKRLEAELEETKAELRLLKEREEETEVALASLNAELHKNMSKLAAAEADQAAAAAKSGGREVAMRRVEGLPTLADILSSVNGENSSKQYCGYGYGERREMRKVVMKKKPIVPLVGDLFSWKKKKGSSTTLHNPLYSSPQLHFD